MESFLAESEDSINSSHVEPVQVTANDDDLNRGETALQKVPDHFSDEELLSHLEKANLDYTGPSKYVLSLGIILKLRRGAHRLLGRYKYRGRLMNILAKLDEDELFYQLTLAFCSSEEMNSWPKHLLCEAAFEMSRKVLTLSPALARELDYHPLIYSSSLPVGIIEFDPNYVRRVSEYQKSVERPEGTFSLLPVAEKGSSPEEGGGDKNLNLGVYDEDECKLMKELSTVERDTCYFCTGRRQLYCGDCGGRRTKIGEDLLPRRIGLPFDILLLVHWNESLHKCTGVHAAVLSVEGTVEVIQWTNPKKAVSSDVIHGKENNNITRENMNLIASLDPARDVILFPYDSAITADEFPWYDRIENKESSSDKLRSDIESLKISAEEPHQCPSSSMGSISNFIEGKDPNVSPRKHRYRLVVLECSWSHGNTMAHQISLFREQFGLPPLPCVSLSGIVGLYWRFHEEGNSAVSTIEAIAHTAAAAGASREDIKSLLQLFRLQRWRVLTSLNGRGATTSSSVSSSSVSNRAGGTFRAVEKAPRAVEVSGRGIAGWSHLRGYIK